MKKLSLFFLLALAAFGQQPPVRSAICEPSSASGTTYTCTASPTLAAYTTGLRMQFKADVANTGAVTINVDTLGAKALTKLSGAINTALAANDLRAGQYVLAIYDGTQFQMLSQLGNAAAAGGGSSVLLGYISGTVSASTTSIISFGGSGAPGSTFSTIAQAMPRAGTLANLRIHTSNAQSATGAMTCTISIATAASAETTTGTIDSALQIVVGAGDNATWYSDTSGTVAVAAGDRVAVSCANAATATSATIRSVSVELQ